MFAGQFPRLVTIGNLPDEVLLEIFDLYMHEIYDDDHDRWHMLVHLCRRWRSIVFASPRRLNLQLCCSSRRSVRKMLDIWPELPIIISSIGDPGICDAENVIAALELNDRVSRIRLWVDPYLSLTHLTLGSTADSKMASIVPGSFMGGYAPRLHSISSITGITFICHRPCRA